MNITIRCITWKYTHWTNDFVWRTLNINFLWLKWTTGEMNVKNENGVEEKFFFVGFSFHFYIEKSKVYECTVSVRLVCFCRLKFELKKRLCECLIRLCHVVMGLNIRLNSIKINFVFKIFVLHFFSVSLSLSHHK